MSYTIIYGYDEQTTINIIKELEKNNEKIILIEPFLKNIEKINEYQKVHKFNVIKKLLTPDYKPEEIIIYEKDNKKYTLDKILNYTKKHKVFTTSLCHIIKEYDIDSINNIYINIDISNLKNLFDKWNFFNYLIDRVAIPLNINQDILNHLFFTKFEEHISLNKNSSIDFRYMHYIHKNGNIKSPGIMMYDMYNKNENIKFKKFIQRYNINDVSYNNEEKYDFLHEKILYNLDKIFKRNDLQNVDILIQMNSNYFKSSEYFCINYEIKDTILYINKEFDIIYSTKNCMHMLYEIIKSKYFEEYIEEEKMKKKKIFKIFYKRLFYEYLQNIFKVIYI